MSTTVAAYGVQTPTAPVAQLSIERRDPGPRDVLIKIDFCGICHSDIHHARGDWGDQYYPAVTGHEIVGHVAAVGPEVTKHQVGDVVGVGCMVDSCRTCDQCQAGQEQYCLNGNTGTYGSPDKDGTYTKGGYSQTVVVDQDFVVKVPAGLDLAA
ncbi:MAG: alcohol dehydrogenase catalytic domain-containing protein, partial [Bifidobacteriaceae bacterium]|nr:alcohol dehydrogenase catalytic domain-containing protein [Bifidobacteriaceae bacterium]